MLKTYIGAVKALLSLSVVSLAAAQGWSMVLAPVILILVVFPLKKLCN